jgi:microcompartment protein CcmK/EutM
VRLARVTGQVIATRKDPRLVGSTLLLVEWVDHQLRPLGRPRVALDGIQSREGDLVFVVTAREASFGIPGKVTPSDCSIVGKVDDVSA